MSMCTPIIGAINIIIMVIAAVPATPPKINFPDMPFIRFLLLLNDFRGGETLQGSQRRRVWRRSVRVVTFWTPANRYHCLIP